MLLDPMTILAKAPTYVSHEGFWHRRGTTHCFFTEGRSSTLGGEVLEVTAKSSKDEEAGPAGSRHPQPRKARPGVTNTIKLATPGTDDPDVKHPGKAQHSEECSSWLQEYLPRKGSSAPTSIMITEHVSRPRRVVSKDSER